MVATVNDTQEIYKSLVIFWYIPKHPLYCDFEPFSKSVTASLYCDFAVGFKTQYYKCTFLLLRLHWVFVEYAYWVFVRGSLGFTSTS